MTTPPHDISTHSAHESEDELYEHYHFVADKGQNPLRIDKYLMQFIENATRSKIQQSIRADCVQVNGRAVKPNYKVRPADDIRIVLPYPPNVTEIIPEDIPLDIIYEDSDLCVVNKPAGMVVHPGYGNYTGTLVHALAYHLRDEIAPTGDPLRPGLVHRIDKNTSGLLVIAKNEYTHAMLAKQFFDHTSDRTYLALVWGQLPDEKGTIVGHLDRNPRDRLQMIVFPDGDQGRHAITHYEVMEDLYYLSYVKCKLETGRTHQIRAHMKYLGHPLFNDERYGGEMILKGMPVGKYKTFVQNCFEAMPRQALHAHTLGFVHPSTGESMLFEQPLPSDMEEVLGRWRRYAHYHSI